MWKIGDLPHIVGMPVEGMENSEEFPTPFDCVGDLNLKLNFLAEDGSWISQARIWDVWRGKKGSKHNVFDG